MKISTKARHAPAADAGPGPGLSGEPVPLRDVAQRQEISDKYLEQIVTPLPRRPGAQRPGAGGGYLLTRAPSAYTVGEILRPLEEPCTGELWDGSECCAAPSNASRWRSGRRSKRRCPA